MRAHIVPCMNGAMFLVEPRWHGIDSLCCGACVGAMLSESTYSTLHEWCHVLVEPRWPGIDSLGSGACGGAMLSDSTYIGHG